MNLDFKQKEIEVRVEDIEPGGFFILPPHGVLCARVESSAFVTLLDSEVNSGLRIPYVHLSSSDTFFARKGGILAASRDYLVTPVTVEDISGVIG